jgi:hypothetical protein
MVMVIPLRKGLFFEPGRVRLMWVHWEELDGVAGEVEGGIFAIADGDFARAQEARVPEAVRSVEGCVPGDDARLELGEDGEEDGAGDGLHWFAVLLAVEALDPSDEALHDGQLANGEGEVSIDVEGAYGREVSLDGLRLDPSGKAGDPGHDSGLGGRKNGAVSIVHAVEPDEVDEATLVSAVGSSGVG